MTGFFRLAFALLAVLLLSGRAGATPLNLTLGLPDILSSFIDVTYDAATDSLIASGFALEIDDDGIGAPIGITGGTFDLSAMIDATGALGGGMLTIGGTVAALGFNSGTLLTGTLTAFGFPDLGGDPLEFLFTPSGGDAAGLYAPGPAGIIMSATGFGGDFNVDFDNLIGGDPGTGSGVSDTAPLPEPAAIALLAVGFAGLYARRRSG